MPFTSKPFQLAPDLEREARRVVHKADPNPDAAAENCRALP